MIEAKIIAHSVAPNGKEIVTFELVYPRFIHSELMTHRMFSRNAASSRAIPVEKMIEMVRTSPAMPVHWGVNQPGMQAEKELTGFARQQSISRWKWAAGQAAECAEALSAADLHKQVANRLLEPFQLMKTVVTATEWDNFFWLRKHPDAQPEIRVLAEKMWEILQESEPNKLYPGWWHVPYFSGEILPGMWADGMESMSLQDALAISSSCCAQVSYRKLDDSLEKAQMIYNRLVESTPVHASPFEHQATPMEIDRWPGYCDADVWLCHEEEGVTHADRDGFYWSGNFKSWIQYRQLIPNNVCNNYSESEV
tara:strand:+ start:2625 stop:3554 length:930 start_codon:yes stop_codon:yes gene_type:complete